MSPDGEPANLLIIRHGETSWNRERRVMGSATDGVGPIARIEMSVAGSGEWYPFFPRDGIYDQQREDFDVDVSTFATAGRAVIAVRVYDQANNFIVRHVTLP